jgi:hypothetical protein
MTSRPNEPVSELSVAKTMQVRSALFAALPFVDQRFVVVPEPMTFFLLGAGLMGLFASGRRVIHPSLLDPDRSISNAKAPVIGKALKVTSSLFRHRMMPLAKERCAACRLHVKVRHVNAVDLASMRRSRILCGSSSGDRTTDLRALRSLP